jgi:hypothetical protein
LHLHLEPKFAHTVNAVLADEFQQKSPFRFEVWKPMELAGTNLSESLGAETSIQKLGPSV